MKIACTMYEYTRMIRMCQRSQADNGCRGCILEDICGNNILEDAIEFDIKIEEENQEGS